jgi:hypothetical protein
MSESVGVMLRFAHEVDPARVRPGQVDAIDATRRPACLCTHASGGAVHALPARRRDGTPHRRSCYVADQGAVNENPARQLQSASDEPGCDPTVRRKATRFKAGRLLSIVFGATASLADRE